MKRRKTTECESMYLKYFADSLRLKKGYAYALTIYKVCVSPKHKRTKNIENSSKKVLQNIKLTKYYGKWKVELNESIVE